MTQGFQDLFEQAMKFKINLEELKKELADKTVEIVTGHDEVHLVMNGLQEILSIRLQAQDLPAPQQQRLELLLKRALNQGIARSRELAGQEITNQTGFNPSLLNGLF
ncbi:MAG: YbaB/EbfC family nucleoid-associated protein [Bacillota bacterium]